MQNLLSRLACGLHALTPRHWQRPAKVLIAASSLAGMGGQAVAQSLDVGFAALEGLRYGISVTDLEGNVLVDHRAHERFMPASNAKLFVTAAALAAEEQLSALDRSVQLIAEPGEGEAVSLAVVGRGDPTIEFGPSCKVRCIETLAKAAAAQGIGEVENVIGDDQWFADEPRPLGWSWDDLKFGHGTSISALTVNQNVVPLRVAPASAAGANVRAGWANAGGTYFELENEAETVARGAGVALRLERRIGDRVARLYGELPRGARSVRLNLGVDDPAHLAAWYLEQALEAEGITVTGELRSRRRPLRYADEPIVGTAPDEGTSARCRQEPEPRRNGTVIATLEPAPIFDVVKKINRDSQNLYAEVLLRQLGRAAGTGSTFCGLLQIEAFLEEIGVPREDYDIADGSGLSNYNRATPATLTAVLRHAAASPWGEAYRESLPVGGKPGGTLRYRFLGTPLAGKISAKTGTLNHVDALSGYMEARSGKTLAFSVIVNDRPLETPSALGQIQKVLVEIAAAH